MRFARPPVSGGRTPTTLTSRAPRSTSNEGDNPSAGASVFYPFRRPVTTMAKRAAWWAISTDGRRHSLVPVGDHLPGALGARCGHPLPWGVVAHDHLLGWQWLPAVPVELPGARSAFPPFKTPAGRRLSQVPGGQSASSPAGTRIWPTRQEEEGSWG